ncbi:MAG: ABC transporter ATP-binding protein [Bryobacterales bacterium]|nr:ABC transporter ATP-binding protein [Bryobacterales bacterium]
MSTTATAPMIEARGLTRRFGSLLAVEALDLQIPRGEIYGLVGPDGAGKSTTLRLFCGLIDPHEGEALVGGINPSQDAHAVRDRIGYMPQRFGLYTDLTVEENLYFYSDLFGIVGAQRDGLMLELLRMTRMEPFRKRLAGKLSGGMKQKLALMSTLLHRPEVLFLDEPTNGVDPVSRRDFWTILYRLVRDGLTVLLTTAYLDEAERCNRVGLMYKGRLIREDKPQAIREQMKEKCYAITCAKVREARAILLSQPEVLSAESSAGGLHVFLGEGGGVAMLLNALRQQGIPDAGARPVLPSLEDVFIALVRKAEREQAAPSVEQGR